MKKTLFLTLTALLTTAALAHASGLFDLHYRNVRVHDEAEARQFRNHCLRPDEAAQAIVFPSMDYPGDLIVQFPVAAPVACNFFDAQICEKRCGEE